MVEEIVQLQTSELDGDYLENDRALAIVSCGFSINSVSTIEVIVIECRQDLEESVELQTSK